VKLWQLLKLGNGQLMKDADLQRPNVVGEDRAENTALVGLSVAFRRK